MALTNLSTKTGAGTYFCYKKACNFAYLSFSTTQPLIASTFRNRSLQHSSAAMSFAGMPSTTYQDWCRTDAFHNSFLIPHDEAVEAGLKHMKEEGMPDIEVSQATGRFLYLLAKTINAKRVLEVGTLGG